MILENIEMNGKEMPHASFLKFTSHQFLSKLRDTDPHALKIFRVSESNKSHSFWQRDSLAIELFSEDVAIQKLNYIHNNPCQGKWMLAADPVDYYFSSYKYYESGIDRFGFLNHLGERF
ncbi:transposase [Algoriphagus sp.]|uniref:transposase n=1 Tax=Algoriphagus sp. TaxID=1872435 RepID=UPI0025BC220A|nr:transposase [Algoriphagus sp.]